MVLILLIGQASLVGQFQRPPRYPVPGAPGGPPVVLNPEDDESRITEQMKKARNAMRQKKLVSQMQLLARLTNELKADVDKTDTLSADDIHKSEQIEKLARNIRELMIGPL